MSDTITVALIVAIPGTIAALTSALAVFIGIHNKNKLSVVAESVNGVVEKLQQASENTGRIAEITEQRARKDLKDSTQ